MFLDSASLSVQESETYNNMVSTDALKTFVIFPFLDIGFPDLIERIDCSLCFSNACIHVMNRNSKAT